MSRPAALLRLLLSLVLILNGVGGALASTGMQMKHAGWMQAASHADAAPPAAQPPCDEHAGMAMSEDGAGTAAMADASAKTAPVKAVHRSDCCESGTCQCTCAHQSQVVTATIVFAEPVIGHSTSIRSMKPAHPAPALPHLIRPPIG